MLGAVRLALEAGTGIIAHGDELDGVLGEFSCHQSHLCHALRHLVCIGQHPDILGPDSGGQIDGTDGGLGDRPEEIQPWVASSIAMPSAMQ